MTDPGHPRCRACRLEGSPVCSLSALRSLRQYLDELL
jgi:hypothetical protein